MPSKIVQMTRNLIKNEDHPMPSSVSATDRFKMDAAQSRAQTRDAAADPKVNPAGKGQFAGAWAPYDNRSNHSTYAKPDAGHAARLRGKRARSWDTIVKEPKK